MKSGLAICVIDSTSVRILAAFGVFSGSVSSNSVAAGEVCALCV